MKYKIYGYGIVDKNGKPWWDESCVCENRAPMDDECKNLNSYSRGFAENDNRIPYRVVRLLYAVKDKK